MATIITGTPGTDGTNGASPTNGTVGGNASFTKNGTIGLDSLDYDVKGGKGGKGGNGAPPPANGANGGNGGNATITINGNIANNPATTTLSIKAKATGGEGGDAGTGVLSGLRGNGGNATISMNGNIINPNKAMTTIELLADAIGGDGNAYGNASASINGNIVQPKSAINVTLEASATAFGPDSVANHGNAAFGTKTATVNGNVVQGNIQNVTLAADAYPSNGTARVNGNIIQLSGALTTSGAVALIASGNVIEMTQNKVYLNKQSLSLFITQYNPYTTTIQNNEFYGTGTNFFNFSAGVIPGPYSNTVSINLASGTFVFNGQNNILSNFNSAIMSGNVVSTLIGNNDANFLTGALGADFLTGGKGNDTLDGGANTDTAIYVGNFADYTVAVNILGNGTVTDNIPARDGLDTLTSIEFIQFADGTYNTALGLFVPFGPPNTAPVLNAAQSPTLTAQLEDSGAPVGAVGTLVSSLVDFAVPAGQVDNVTDPDVGALLGIALTGTDTANGAWFYSTDNGATWNAVGAVSDPTARLLAADAGTRLYFQPNANFNGAVPAAITFRAWDRTSGSNGGTGNASVNGGTTAFSTATDTASLSITAVNDAPVLDATKSPTLAAIAEDSGVPVGAVGTLVSSLVDYAVPAGQVDNVTDVDGPALGIAVNGSSVNGTLFYSIDNGVTWNMAGALSDATALLLAADANTRVYFQPNADFNGNVTNAITFRAWDQSSGVNGGSGNATVNGGTTAFSSATDTAAITVNNVNDAPVLNAAQSPTLSAVLEDAIAPSGAVGTLVSSLVDFAIPAGQVDNVTDVDPSPLLGIALTGTGPSGSWFYSTDNGATWNAVGMVSNASALLLAADASTRLYFQPNANFNGASNVTFRAWDRTTGSNGQSGVNTGMGGGTSAFSAVTDTASIAVTSVNDAPAGADNTVSTPLNTAYVFTAADFGFTDPNDSPANSLLAVRITTLPGAGSLTNNGNPVNAGDYVSVANIIAGLLQFTPALNGVGPNYANFTFQVQDDGGITNGGVDLDQTPNTITLDVAGGENYFGTPGNDNHTGTVYDDVMHVSAGIDTLDGAGHINGDTLTFDTADAGVIATINSVTGGYTVGGFAGITTSVNFEHLTGSGFNDTLTGDAGRNIVSGGAGDDILVATPGGMIGDTLDGGAHGLGGDTASFGLAGSGVTVNLGGGVQNVGGGIGNITLTNIENLTGSGFGDGLTGNGGNNVLSGMGGADTLTGGLGNDTLDGGTGIDTAVFSTQPGIGNVGWNGSAFVVTGPDGTDTVTNVEVLDDGAGAKVLLVGAGGYATINAAIAAANIGDTILIAPGTYNENVLVNKSVTLAGVAPGVIIQGTFETDNAIGGDVNTFLRTNAYSGVAGNGIEVSANNVTIQNITVDGFLNAIAAKNSGGAVSGLTLNNVTMQDSVFGLIKDDTTTLNNLTVNGGLIQDAYIGVYFYNDNPTDSDANNTIIDGTTFQDITQKGIYAETLQGNTLFDNLTMNNVGQYGGGVAFGANGANGAGIDANLKFHTYTGTLTISNFDFDNVGSSTGVDPTGHQNAAAIAIKGRDDPTHPLYSVNPADVSGLVVNIVDGDIDGTSTGIRAGEAGKANSGLNVTGPALNIDNVEITNNLSNTKHDQIDNRTQSQMTVTGSSGDDTYISAQTITSTGPIAFYGLAGNDYLVGGLGDDTLQGGADDDVLDGGSGFALNGDTADYSDATSDGLVVNLLTGTSSGGGLGNDTLASIQNLIGSDYNDMLVGDDNDNALTGGLGNDVLWGHGGLNQMTGDAGTDVAYYVGRETDYAVFETPFVRSISGGLEGVNDAMLIADLERVKFLAPSHVSDVDGDLLGTSDLVYQNAVSGDLTIIREPEPGVTLGVAGIGGNNWRMVGTGQFDPDADRLADVLLQDNVTGDLKVVTDLTGAQTQTLLDTQPGSNVWKAISTGDFNGDAASDVLLQNQMNGMVEIMFLNTNAGDAIGTVASTGWLSTPGANWKVISAGDFNGDGKSDILWQNSTTKQVQVHLMDGVVTTNAPLSQNAPGLTAIGTGDFNGDGYSDALFKNASGQAVVWFMYGDVRTGTKTITKPGAAFNLSGASDVDGNGYSDLVWTDASNNAVATRLEGPSSLASTTVMPGGPVSLTHPGAGYNLLASTGGG